MKGNENIKHPIGIDPQEITGAAAPGTTVEGPAVDCRGFEEGLVTLQHGAVSDGGTLSCKVQESDIVDQDFDDIEDATFADVAGGALVASGVYVGRLNLAGRKRYIRVVATLVGAEETALVSALVTLHQARELPVSQVNALAFNLS
ncbi:MAG: hypothetical protein L6277_12750 [Desulfobacterales bacterium]|nr:hypothetical protein [Pseudomonadota bacterium]MBU4353772.1 hypothetical protein [Pseudomonadota bacterium]MCG2772943.1 hypothetical protein [Desulfobacterales bacterium]